MGIPYSAIFSRAKLWRITTISIFGGEKFGRCLAVSSGCLAVWRMPSSFGEEYFGDSCTVCRIRQYFPRQKIALYSSYLTLPLATITEMCVLLGSYIIYSAKHSSLAKKLYSLTTIILTLIVSVLSQ